MEHRHFYIFDLDGTLANIEHRSHFVRNGNRQWNEFFEACDHDEPNWGVAEIFNQLASEGCDVEIWSGRSDQVEEKTRAWLDKYFSVNTCYGTRTPGSSFLRRMRPKDDYQKDSELKRSWLNEEREKGNVVIAVFDDRQQVVDMWREEGITCCQVAPGDFDNPKTKKIFDRTPNLVMMIGPSGAGKSTYLVNNNVAPSKIVSTDAIREELWGDRNSPECFTQENFVKPHLIAHNLVRQRLEMGLDVVHDATNIKPKDRKRLIDELDGLEYSLVYVIVDRPLEEKLETIGLQDESVVRRHHETFAQNVKYALNGDGIPGVQVFDMRK